MYFVLVWILLLVIFLAPNIPRPFLPISTLNTSGLLHYGRMWSVSLGRVSLVPSWGRLVTLVPLTLRDSMIYSQREYQPLNICPRCGNLWGKLLGKGIGLSTGHWFFSEKLKSQSGCCRHFLKILGWRQIRMLYHAIQKEEIVWYLFLLLFLEGSNLWTLKFTILANIELFGKALLIYY